RIRNLETKGKTIHYWKYLPMEGSLGSNGSQDLREPICVTPLRRAGFPVFPRVAACHDEATAESLVRAPVDADASQGRLGGCVYRDLGAPDHGQRKGIPEEVIWIPSGLQVRLRGDGIDGVAILLAGFKGPLVDGGVHLAAIVQDAASLR